MYREPAQFALFDLAVGGHHGTYIWHLVKYWSQSNEPATLHIIVSPEFLEQHLEVVELIDQSSKTSIHLLPISREESKWIQAQTSIVKRAFAEWKLFCRYARQIKADQGLFMQIDHLQLPIVFGERSPCPVSGIYFRPTFHYVQFASYTSNWKDAIRRWRQKVLLAMVLRSGQMNALFSLDPFAPQAIEKLTKRVEILHLADPIVPHAIDTVRSHQLRIRLNVDVNRQLFLLFGKLDPRKGTYQLLEAIRQLPQELAPKICLLFVGQIPDSEKAKLKDRIAELSAQSSVQILIHDAFVPESEMPLYFQMSDVVLAPYQRHVGMSGILLQAAAAQKPVIASDYGLMGELVQQYQLGLTTDCEQPSAITQSIVQILQNKRLNLVQCSKMQAFVEQNLAEKFVKMLVTHLVEH